MRVVNGFHFAYKIYYYGFGRPSFRYFFKSPDEVWKVEIIGTWEMTVTYIGYSGRFRVQLPGKEYVAVRLVRVAEKNILDAAFPFSRKQFSAF